jgi:hypothetical protein
VCHLVVIHHANLGLPMKFVFNRDHIILNQLELWYVRVAIRPVVFALRAIEDLALNTVLDRYYFAFFNRATAWSSRFAAVIFLIPSLHNYAVAEVISCIFAASTTSAILTCTIDIITICLAIVLIVPVTVLDSILVD